MKDLEQLLRDEDPGAVAAARAGGDAALGALEATASHPESGVRLLVVECLEAIGSAGAVALLVERVEDGEGEVRLEAVNALLSCAEREPAGVDAGAILACFDRARDGYLRRQLALVLGRLGASRSRLKTRLHATDQARDGLLAALARAGEPSARVRLARLLREAEGERFVELIGLFRAVDRPEHALDLLPVIEREDVVQNVSSHRRQIVRRACDLGIDEFLRLRPGELTFGQRPAHEPYSYTELVEIRQRLRAEASAEDV